MPLAVITIDRIDKSDAGYMHFYDKSQKAWNCNKPDLFNNFAAGERYFIDYNETEPKAGRKYGSKYINRARFAKEEDGPNTWPDKEPYTGGGGSGYTSKGGGTMKKDFDPTTSKRQTAAHVAGAVLKSEGTFNIDEFAVNFPVVADIVFKWIDTQPKSDDAGAGDGGAASEEDFGF